MTADDALYDILEVAVTQGLIGPASLRFQVAHAESFLERLEDLPAEGVDIGSGGGLPGLVLAWRHREMRWTLVDGKARATGFLVEAVERLELDDRVTVVQARTEELGRLDEWRETRQLVTARSYGPPAVVAEGAAGILAVGGRLVVSEPPSGGGPARWPVDGLAPLGLAPTEVIRTEHGSFQVLEKVEALDDRFPRRTGVVKKRPLFLT